MRELKALWLSKKKLNSCGHDIATFEKYPQSLILWVINHNTKWTPNLTTPLIFKFRALLLKIEMGTYGQISVKVGPWALISYWHSFARRNSPLYLSEKDWNLNQKVVSTKWSWNTRTSLVYHWEKYSKARREYNVRMDLLFMICSPPLIMAPGGSIRYVVY